MMTRRELQTRTALFMAELGRCDAMAQLEQRTGSDGSVQDALHRFRQRYAPGSTVDELLAYRAYADAFAEATRSNRGDGFVRGGAVLMCATCGSGLDGRTGELAGFQVDRTRASTIEHVLRVSHLARAEQRVAAAMRFPNGPKPRREIGAGGRTTRAHR